MLGREMPLPESKPAGVPPLSMPRTFLQPASPKNPHSPTLRRSPRLSPCLNSSSHRTQIATAPQEPVPSGGQFGLWKAGGGGAGIVPLPTPHPTPRWSGLTRNMLILKQSAFGSSHEKLNVGVVS